MQAAEDEMCIRSARQEFPEDVWIPNTRTGGGNIDTGEGQTPLASSEHGKRSSYGIPTPESPILTASASLDFYGSPQQPSPEDRVFSNNFGKPEIGVPLSHNKHKRLSRLLLE
ncbi:hypothetical protein VN97_g9997 [Penicillium thymicola]|uniref:Uncharacterized protein n=1 Tax=Penicillium thymicola TaxID=293382 RepID=A0AAI9TAH5_PENTH|nr:hypothetical protein VN97_g9997 [Penicillium thymicola]